MKRDEFDLVVLGGGTAGLISAAVAGYLGARTALIEENRLGGDCLNSGCVPSKALIRGARGNRELQWLQKERLLTTDLLPGGGVSFTPAMERMRKIRAEIALHDSPERFREEFGVTVFEDRGEFTASNRITLSRAPQEITFRRCIIATGAGTAIPPIPGLNEVSYLTNETLFELHELPERLVILGAGPIGCEMAQAFANLGSSVTLIDAAPRILPREDTDVAELMAQHLQDAGVTLHTAVAVTNVARDTSEDPVIVTLGGAAGSGARDTTVQLSVTGSHLLLATGRVPRVENLGLDLAGVRCTTPPNPGRIAVDSFLRTANRRIFAAGDVAVPWQFTHAAEATAAIAVQNALLFPSTRTTRVLIPRCTYTTPEIAHVGITADEAESQGIAIDRYTHSFSAVDRARIDGTTDGFVRLITKRKSPHLLGATVVGPHAGEIIPTITLAMRHRLGMRALGSLVYPYPTLGEAVKRAAAGYIKGKLTARRKRLLQWYWRIQRALSR